MSSGAGGGGGKVFSYQLSVIRVAATDRSPFQLEYFRSQRAKPHVAEAHRVAVVLEI
jgi:hypothetical protein